MIDEANIRLKGFGGRLKGSAEFAVGDINSLSEPSNQYDKVVAIRVLINLGSWEISCVASKNARELSSRAGCCCFPKRLCRAGTS